MIADDLEALQQRLEVRDAEVFGHERQASQVDATVAGGEQVPGADGEAVVGAWARRVDALELEAARRRGLVIQQGRQFFSIASDFSM